MTFIIGWRVNRVKEGQTDPHHNQKHCQSLSLNPLELPEGPHGLPEGLQEDLWHTSLVIQNSTQPRDHQPYTIQE